MVEVRAAKECVGFVLFFRKVHEGKIIVSKVGNIASNLLVYVLGVVVVFKILVVGVDCDRVRRSHEEAMPVGETMDKGKQFLVMDIVVSFCF